MKSSTRKLIGRLRKLINEAGEGCRRAKEWQRTPWHQRPPQPKEPNWSARAHFLCATRADMRGRLHQSSWLGLQAQREAIEKALEAATKWEAFLKEPRVDLTFPNWLRCTIRDAVKAGDVERNELPARKERRLRYKAAS